MKVSRRDSESLNQIEMVDNYWELGEVGRYFGRGGKKEAAWHHWAGGLSEVRFCLP